MIFMLFYPIPGMYVHALCTTYTVSARSARVAKRSRLVQLTYFFTEKAPRLVVHPVSKCWTPNWIPTADTGSTTVSIHYCYYNSSPLEELRQGRGIIHLLYPMEVHAFNTNVVPCVEGKKTRVWSVVRGLRRLRQLEGGGMGGRPAYCESCITMIRQ